MRRPLIRPAIILVVCISAMTVAIHAARNAGEAATAPAFVEDVARLRSALEEGAPTLYRHRSKAAVDSALSALADSARTTVSTARFWSHLVTALAFIRDGHLAAIPGAALGSAPYGRMLPFDVRVLGERLYVVRSPADSGTPVSGSEILAMNGVSTPLLISRCLEHASRDGVLQTRGFRLIERDFTVTCGPSLGLPSEYVVTSRASAEASVRIDTIAAVSFRQRRATRRTEPSGLRFLPGERLAVLTVRSFSKSDEYDPEAFFQRSFRTIADSGIRALVIDLRENGGGRDGHGARLFAHVASDTFTFARRIILRRNFSFADWVTNWRIRLFISTKRLSDGRLALDESLDRPQRPVRNAFRGPIVVVADRSTYSTASEVVALFQHYGRATIVGEETASGREGDSGATIGLYLPALTAVVQIPIVMYELPGAGTAPGRGVLPDIPVEPTIGDVLAGRDPVLQAALRIARQST